MTIKPIVEWAIYAGIIAGLASVVATGRALIGSKVYDGEIDKEQITYEEGRWLNLFGDIEEKVGNRMTITKDGITYTFIDSENKTPIDWENDIKPDFEKDSLERVVLTSEDSLIEYKMEDMNVCTILGRKTNEVFALANPRYNNLRIKIREKLREDYTEKQNAIISILRGDE